MREKLKRWREKLKSEREKQKSGVKYQKVNNMGGKKKRGESRYDMLPNIEKGTVCRLTETD